MMARRQPELVLERALPLKRLLPLTGVSTYQPFSDIIYLREETVGERMLLSAAAVQHARKML
jgi:hypothetical protein